MGFGMTLLMWCDVPTITGSGCREVLKVLVEKCCRRHCCSLVAFSSSGVKGMVAGFIRKGAGSILSTWVLATVGAWWRKSEGTSPSLQALSNRKKQSTEFMVDLLPKLMTQATDQRHCNLTLTTSLMPARHYNNGGLIHRNDRRAWPATHLGPSVSHSWSHVRDFCWTRNFLRGCEYWVPPQLLHMWDLGGPVDCLVGGGYPGSYPSHLITANHTKQLQPRFSTISVSLGCLKYAVNSSEGIYTRKWLIFLIQLVFLKLGHMQQYVSWTIKIKIGTLKITITVFLGTFYKSNHW